MDLGLYVDAHPGLGPVAAAAEDAGFATLWVYDSPLVYGDVFLACHAALLGSERIAVGPGVTYPGSRPVHVLAQTLATLSKIAPGRVVCGIGRGNSARHAIGAPPHRLDEVLSYVEAVRDLLAGGTAALDGRRLVRLLHPHGRWIDLEPHVPLWLSTFGPVGQRRAATCSALDGVLVRWTGPDGVAEVRARVGDRARLGVVHAVAPVFDEAELETEAARAALGPLVVSRLRYLTANHASADEVPPAFRRGYVEYAAYRETLEPATRHLENFVGYLVFTPEHLERFVTPEAMRAVCRVGSPAEVAAELDLMAESGVDHASLQLAGDPHPWLARMREDVLPRCTGLTATERTA